MATRFKQPKPPPSDSGRGNYKPPKPPSPGVRTASAGTAGTGRGNYKPPKPPSPGTGRGNYKPPKPPPPIGTSHPARPKGI